MRYQRMLEIVDDDAKAVDEAVIPKAVELAGDIGGRVGSYLTKLGKTVSAITGAAGRTGSTPSGSEGGPAKDDAAVEPSGEGKPPADTVPSGEPAEGEAGEVPPEDVKGPAVPEPSVSDEEPEPEVPPSPEVPGEPEPAPKPEPAPTPAPEPKPEPPPTGKPPVTGTTPGIPKSAEELKRPAVKGAPPAQPSPGEPSVKWVVSKATLVPEIKNVIASHADKGRVVINFRKVDGTLRRMECTRDLSLVPQALQPKNQHTVPITQMAVYDFNAPNKKFPGFKGDWRRFVVQRVVNMVTRDGTVVLFNKYDSSNPTSSSIPA